MQEVQHDPCLCLHLHGEIPLELDRGLTGFFLGGAYRTAAHSLVTIRLILCNNWGGCPREAEDSSEGNISGDRKGTADYGCSARIGSMGC
jgi:hypothetical protein